MILLNSILAASRHICSVCSIFFAPSLHCLTTMLRLSRALVAEAWRLVPGSRRWRTASTSSGRRVMRCMGRRRKEDMGRNWQSGCCSSRFTASTKSGRFLQKEGKSLTRRTPVLLTGTKKGKNLKRTTLALSIGMQKDGKHLKRTTLALSTGIHKASKNLKRTTLTLSTGMQKEGKNLKRTTLALSIGIEEGKNLKRTTLALSTGMQEGKNLTRTTLALSIGMQKDGKNLIKKITLTLSTGMQKEGKNLTRGTPVLYR